MNVRLFALFCCVSFLLFSSGAPIWAKAPSTAKIVFSSKRDGNSDIWTMNPDGSDPVRLTQHAAGDSFPVWSPNGEQILFVSNRDGVYDLYLMDADGNNVRKIFKSAARRFFPTWSPDGKKIAYSKRDERGIYTATIDGEEETLVAQVGEGGDHPDWSPDGTEIVFVSSIGAPDPGSFLQIINLETGKQETLLPNELPLMRRPAWSPSGDKIVFFWLNQDVWDVNVILKWGPFGVMDLETLYVVNRDGSGLRELVDPDTGPNRYPVWSPNGDEILFSRGDDSYNLFKVALGSQVTTQLTDHGNNVAGDWFDPAALPVQPNVKLLTTTWGKLKQK